MKRSLSLIAPLLLALGGCAAMYTGPRSSATEQQIRACETQADQIYALRHPNATYQSDTEATGVGTPFSGAIGRSTPQLLAGQHSRSELVNQCLNGQTGTAPINVKRPKPQP